MIGLAGTVGTLAGLLRSQWLGPDDLRRLQEQKLRRLVDHAYASVPFYRAQFDRAGITPASIRSLADLERIPVTTKEQLQAAGEPAILSDRFATATLRSARTSGSSGRPFTIRLDPRFVRVKNAAFLRALWAVGVRPGHRMLLVVSSARHQPRRRWLGWRYTASEVAPAAVAAEIRRHRPHVLYGPVTPLREAALEGERSGAGLPRPRLVLTTGEALDPAARRILAGAFAAPVLDLYGLSETGLLAWECRARSGLHISQETSIVECLRPPGEDGPGRLVVTNLELMAMPFIRFDTGDLGVPAAAGRCACGRSLARLARVEGRLVDALVLPDGGLLSPYAVTHALDRVVGIRRLQVVQPDDRSLVVRFEALAGDREALGTAIARELEPVLQDRLRLEILPVAEIAVPAGQKFRSVESRVARCAPPERSP